MRYRENEGELIPVIVLIIINLLVYIGVNAALFTGGGITQYLAISPRTFFNFPWTALTYMFTHEQFLHLLFNMLTLYFFGSFLNRIACRTAFLVTYFAGGLVGALAILLLAPLNSFTLGASGAVFALGGALAVIVPQYKVIIFPIPVPMPLWIAILISFLVLAFLPGVSWQGHLGGLLAGLLAGWYLRRRTRIII